jgi:3-hydroxyisobutyrate dehydrogenase
VKVGILGTGLMGQPMALRLLNSGFEVIAYNRTEAKLEPLQAAGITVTTDPLEVVQTADCTILMLTNADVIRELLLAESTQSALAGQTLIQMGTIAPTQSKALNEAVKAAGGHYLEAPVLGSIPQVEDGSLIVMVGATPEHFEQWLPVLQCFSSEPLLMGPVGTGAAAKLAMNQLIGSLTTAFALSLGFVQREGLDVEQFMAIVRQSALYAPTFDKKLQRMLERNFAQPNFPSKHLLKDMNLFAEEAQTLGLEASLARSVSQVVQKTLELGLADDDYSALYSAVNPLE